jgi:FixJ family two-component response regulator
MTDLENHVIETYKVAGNIRTTAKNCGVSEQTARKILITAGEYISPITIQIASMIEQGKTVEKIAAELDMKPKTVQSYMPYRKGSYKAPPSKNALRIRKYRHKKDLG